MAKRYTVMTDRMPYTFQQRGFAAWISDASHPDGSEDPASCAWFMDIRDASRICAALNRDVATQKAVAALRPNDCRA